MQKLCNLLTWIFFWCPVSILSETTLMIVVHTMSLGVFRRHKTVFPVLEDIGGHSGTEVKPAAPHDLRG